MPEEGTVCVGCGEPLDGLAAEELWQSPDTKDWFHRTCAVEGGILDESESEGGDT